MKINNRAKYGKVKEFDENHAIAIASNGKEHEIRIKCLVRDFRNKNDIE